jgi:hypothetical protein
MTYNIVIGWFVGFALGVGCSLAVLYSIYRGGYRKAIEDGVEDPQPEAYRNAVAKAKASQAKRASTPVAQQFESREH